MPDLRSYHILTWLNNFITRRHTKAANYSYSYILCTFHHCCEEFFAFREAKTVIEVLGGNVETKRTEIRSIDKIRMVTRCTGLLVVIKEQKLDEDIGTSAMKLLKLHRICSLRIAHTAPKMTKPKQVSPSIKFCSIWFYFLETAVKFLSFMSFFQWHCKEDLKWIYRENREKKGMEGKRIV